MDPTVGLGRGRWSSLAASLLWIGNLLLRAPNRDESTKAYLIRMLVRHFGAKSLNV
jgi:hypothetical protein